MQPQLAEVRTDIIAADRLDCPRPTLSQALAVSLLGRVRGDLPVAAASQPRVNRPSMELAVKDGQAPPDTDDLVSRLLAVLQPPLETLLQPTGPLEWSAEFRAFQLDGIRLLIERDALLLADEMGLGKTVQAVAAIRLLAHLRRIDSALLVVPASLIPQWRRQIDVWAPELRVSPVMGPPASRSAQWRTPAHIHLVSYETLRADIALAREHDWDLVILDEAQKIKNADSDVSAAIKTVPRARAWALTGTPLENRIDDLASILEFARPLRRGESLPTVQPGTHLRSQLDAIQLRRRKSQVLDLPERIESELSLALEGAQLDAYQRAEQEGLIRLAELGSEIRIENILELILRLKQLCNFDPVTGRSAKLDDLASRLDQVVEYGAKALVFSQFVDERFGVKALARRLERFNPVTYTGEMRITERDAAVCKFMDDRDRHVMILSLHAGGQGLNLQRASYVFHFDRWWNPAKEDQAGDRAHRMGQEFTVNIYGYVLEGTVEERIREIMSSKRELFATVVEGAGIDPRTAFTKEELFSIVGLRPPIAQPLNPLQFEHHLGQLLEAAGYRVQYTPESHDGGIDLIASRPDLGGSLQVRLLIQCKSQTHPVGVDVIRSLAGSFAAGQATGVVASPGGFSPEARATAAERGIQLWGPVEIDKLASGSSANS